MSQVVPPPARRVPALASTGTAVAVAIALLAVPDLARAASPTTVRAVRLVPETRGSGKAQRVVTRIDAFAADGVRRRVRTVPGGGLFQQPALSPDGRRVAFVRPDGRIAIVVLRDGTLRTLRPRGLPTPPPATGPPDPARLTVVEGAAASWSPDGRTVVAHGLVQRTPPRWASRLDDVRSVACTVRTGRCTSAGAGAPADLVPLAGGRTLRLDGPTASDEDEGATTLGLETRRQERLVLAARRDRVRTTLSLTRSALGTGPRRRLSTVLGSGRTGIAGLGSRATGPAGVLLRGSSITFSRSRSDTTGLPDDGPGVLTRTRTLPTRIVTPAGRLRTFPRRLGVTPIGSTADGRWLVPTSDVGPSQSLDRPEPGLATLDRRGRVRAVRIAGRVVTPVRLALAAGLPDGFAAGARFVAARPVGDDLLVQLADTGANGRIFFPGDAALVRVPLDGASPARIVDHEGGASYDVR